MVLLTSRFDNSQTIVPAPYGLLSPAVDVVYETNDTHWEGSFDYEASDFVSIVNISAGSNTVSAVVFAATDGTKTFNEYTPFVIQADITLSTMGNKPEDVRKAVERYLEAATQKALEQEFWTGAISKGITVSDPDHPNRYLASTDADDITPTPGTGVKPKYGFALMEKGLGDAGIGERGLIHSPRDIASMLPDLYNEDDVLLTRLSTPVVAGTGYPGTSPSGATPATGSGWMYGTGPVTVRLGKSEVYQERVQEAVNTSINSITYRATRLAAVTWSNTTHLAVLIDLTAD